MVMAERELDFDSAPTGDSVDVPFFPRGDLQARLRRRLREVSHRSIPGFSFLDVTGLLEHDAKAFRFAVEEMTRPFKNEYVTAIVGVESFGYIFGAPMAIELDARFVLARKPGKLPRSIRSIGYSMVYDPSRSLEMHQDALREDDVVVVVDDVLATGGTIVAASELVQACGARVVGVSVLVELTGLPGRAAVQEAGLPLSCALTVEHRDHT
jgi:adenine phosphoribosyltransferase